MDLKLIEKKILETSEYVKEISVIIQNNSPFAIVYPDFKTLSQNNIINIESEIRWYAIELYNMHAKEEEKIKGYKISLNPLSDPSNDKNKQAEDEPNDQLYKTLKEFLFSQSKKKIFPSSHIELELGLDSLNYVELFVFIEHSYGVKIDEHIFSKNMRVIELYTYIKEHEQFIKPYKTNWRNILDAPIKEKLIYSPFIMFLYKYLLLPLFKIYFRFEIKGIEHIPKERVILAPSHQSMLDGFLIVSSLPYKVLKKTFFLAFKQVFGTDILGPVSKHGQSILIDADDNLKHSMQYALLPLKEGNNLVIFPEGARTRDRELLEFRPYYAMMSQLYNIPIVPVVIDGSFEALRAGMLFPRPKKIKLTYLEPIYPENKSVEEINTLTKAAIQKELDENPVLI